MSANLQALWTRDEEILREIWTLPSAIDPRLIEGHIQTCIDKSLPTFVRRLQEGISHARLDPWQSIQRECGLPFTLPLRHLHPDWRSALAGNTEPATTASGWTWVDFLAIGIYVMVLFAMVCLVSIHFAYKSFPPITRDLVAASLLLPAMAMGAVQIMHHTHPRKETDDDLLLTDASLCGLGECSAYRTHHGKWKETMRLKFDNINFHIATSRGSHDAHISLIIDIPLATHFSLSDYIAGKPGLECISVDYDLQREPDSLEIHCDINIGGVEKHYAHEVRDILWSEVRSILESALATLKPH